MDDAELQSTLLVFGLLLWLISYVVFQGLRAKLSTVPHQALALQQQIAALSAETTSGQATKLKLEAELEELRQDSDRTKTQLLESKQTLHEMQNRLPTVVYVLDQIVQTSYSAWIVTVRWDYPPKGVTAAIAAEMLRGRRILVFADNVPNVRRRLEARFPAQQGYHIGEPATFEL